MSVSSVQLHTNYTSYIHIIFHRIYIIKLNIIHFFIQYMCTLYILKNIISIIFYIILYYRNVSHNNSFFTKNFFYHLYIKIYDFVIVYCNVIDHET